VDRFQVALIGLGMATTAVVLMGLESRGVTVPGIVSGALPTLAIPEISAGQLADLVPLSLIIATVVIVQTAATTPRMYFVGHRFRDQHPPSTDAIGDNISCSPADGSTKGDSDPQEILPYSLLAAVQSDQKSGLFATGIGYS